MGAPGNLAADLGGRAMQPGENMAADQQAAAGSMGRAMALQSAQPDPGQQAWDVISQHLTQLQDVGVMGQMRANAATNQKSGSATERSMLGEDQSDDQLPRGPGFNYMHHLFSRGKRGAIAKARKEHKRVTEGDNIYTDQMEALKTALGVCGVYSDKNPGGMPIDFNTAKKVWFGDTQIGGIEEAEWRSKVERGDNNIDPKRIRKFVNYDGSMTWEILNEDKTVMSRFTMGQYGGVNIFAQGGYSKFADLLDKVKSKVGPTDQGFDSMRKGSLGGGNI